MYSVADARSPDRRGRVSHRRHRIVRANGRSTVLVDGAEKGRMDAAIRATTDRACRRLIIARAVDRRFRPARIANVMKLPFSFMLVSALGLVLTVSAFPHGR